MKSIKLLVIPSIFIIALTSCGLFGISDVPINASVGVNSGARTISTSRTQAVKDQVQFNYPYDALWMADGIMTPGPAPQQAYWDDVLVNQVAYHGIEEFKIASDITLLTSDVNYTSASLMYWGGDVDAEPLVDLMVGDLENNLTAEEAGLNNIIYETVWFQINGDGESLKPTGIDAMSLNEALPIGFVTSTTNIFFSTFIDEPFIAHLLGDGQFDALTNNPNQEVFNEIKNQDFSTFDADVNTDPPVIFLPLENAVDLTSLTANSKVTFRIEGYFDDLLAEYYYEAFDTDTFYLLSPFKSYTTVSGNKVYGPLPFEIKYSIE